MTWYVAGAWVFCGAFWGCFAAILCLAFLEHVAKHQKKKKLQQQRLQQEFDEEVQKFWASCGKDV